MEANKLEKQAQSLARHLMNDKQFIDKVSATATKRNE